MSENKEFYVTIQGKKVEVTEEVYRAYVRPIRTEQRQQRRDWKCRIVGEKGNLVRCNKNCNECKYAENGNKAMGNILSLDKLLEKGVEIADDGGSPEELYLEKEERTSLYEQLHRAIASLTPRQKEIVRLISFERKTEEEIGKQYGITQQAVHNAWNKILRRLKKFFQLFS